MAYRSRTPEFNRLREDHTIRRRRYTDKSSAKKTLLNNTDNYDYEDGVEMKEHIVYLPPEWVARVSDVQYELTNIRTKLHELTDLHKAHLLPGFHDRDDEEQAIDIATGDLTKLFKKVQKVIKGIVVDPKILPPDEYQLKKNIKSELAREVQDFSISFRQSQKNYLEALRHRQAKSGGAFSMSDEVFSANVDTGFSQTQMQRLNDLESEVTQREKDIIRIAKSISELADIFNDLNTLVIDQGTILDRIDYNLENTNANVGLAVDDIKKADEYQKKSRTKMCILLLLILVLCAVVALVIKAIL